MGGAGVWGEKSRLGAPLALRSPVCDVTFPTCRRAQTFLPSCLLGWETPADDAMSAAQLWQLPARIRTTPTRTLGATVLAWPGLAQKEKGGSEDPNKAVGAEAREALGWLLFSHSVVSNSLGPHGLQPARLPCPLPSPRVCSDSRPWGGQSKGARQGLVGRFFTQELSSPCTWGVAGDEGDTYLAPPSLAGSGLALCA